jgi:chromosome segregation ATPase
MRYNDLINENNAPATNDYQQMQNFLSRNKTPGVPPEQQLPLAMFRELQKAQQNNQQLSAELAAAEKRIDVATQGGELTRQELGKHKTQLDKERGDIELQRDKMTQIDKQHSEREQASAEQLRQLTGQLEQIKQKPGVDSNQAKALEKQIADLKKNGVDKTKYNEIQDAVNRMQNMQRVDDQTMQTLMTQVRDAQAKADELVKTRASVGSEIDQTSAQLQNEIDQLKQQLAHFKEVERKVSKLDPMVQDVIAPKVDKLVRRQQAVDNINARDIAQSFAKKEIAGGVKNMLKQPTPAPNPQMDLPGIPPATAQAPAPTAQEPAVPNYDAQRQASDLVKRVKGAGPDRLKSVYESQLLKAIEWATGKK